MVCLPKVDAFQAKAKRGRMSRPECQPTIAGGKDLTGGKIAKVRTALSAFPVYRVSPPANPSDARDAARMEFLAESDRVTYVGVGTSGAWKFHIDHDGGEDLRHDIDVCMKAAIEREGGASASSCFSVGAFGAQYSRMLCFAGRSS